MSGGWKSSFSQRPNTERYKRSILGIATRSDRRLLGAPGLTSSNKKLIVTSASLLVTSALLVVIRTLLVTRSNKATIFFRTQQNVARDSRLVLHQLIGGLAMNDRVLWINSNTSNVVPY